MQIYPEKFERLCLSSEEKSFLRIIERSFLDVDMSYYVLHINPRKKDVGEGRPELFNLFISEKGILLLRFIEIDDAVTAISTINILSDPAIFQMLMSDMSDRLEESRYLINKFGDLMYSLNICFVLPRINSEDIINSFDDTTKEFVTNHVIFKDTIQRIRKNGRDVLLNYLSDGQPIAEEIINNIFQRLCPEITIPRKYIIDEQKNVEINNGKLLDDDRSVLSYRLDNQQIDIINRIDKGHQLILACAGSGKSVLLISKCFKIASLNPSESFLITCYNRNLNNYYQWTISQAGFTDKNVKCVTFYALCKQLLEKNNLPIPSSGSETYFDDLFSMADEALRQGKIKERYAGIFIDEVQIFKPEWYRFCFNLLKSKDPNKYFFIICGDKSQDIKNNIKHGKAPWQGAGDGYPEYRGKTLPIEINYRNSKPINDYIDKFIDAAKAFGNEIGIDLSDDPELFLRGTAYRKGNQPKVVQLKDFSNEGEAKAICNEVKDLIENKGLSEVDISIVFYNRKAKYTSSGWATRYYDVLPIIQTIFDKEGWERPAILISNESEGATFGSRRGVTITTIEGSLGLDFKAIILVGLRQLGIHEKARKEKDFLCLNTEERIEKQEAYKKNINVLYTGCTRAKDELTIILSDKKGESVYSDLIRKICTGD